MTPTYCLHNHSYWSYDAYASPKEYFEAAKKKGVKFFAITEHNNLDSQREFREIAINYPQITFIGNAVEFTVLTSIGAVDLVCYNLPSTAFGLLDMFKNWQINAGKSFCLACQSLGFNFTDEDRKRLLETYRPPHTIAKQGVTTLKWSIWRKYFIQQGWLDKKTTYQEILKKLHGTGHFLPSLSAEKIVPQLKQFGALIVIAHPAKYFNGCDYARMDKLVAECQLSGIECAQPKIPAELTPRYREYCIANNLLSTAGSDSHETKDLEKDFGEHLGEEVWLEEFLDRIQT